MHHGPTKGFLVLGSGRPTFSSRAKGMDQAPQGSGHGTKSKKHLNNSLRHRVWILDGPLWSPKWNSMDAVHCLQLGISCDSALALCLQPWWAVLASWITRELSIQSKLSMRPIGAALVLMDVNISQSLCHQTQLRSIPMLWSHMPCCSHNMEASFPVKILILEALSILFSYFLRWRRWLCFKSTGCPTYIGMSTPSSLSRLYNANNTFKLSGSTGIWWMHNKHS